MAADNSMKPFGGLQDTFLNCLRKEKVPVTVHVVNGYQLNHLLIIGFDSYAILAEAGGKQMLLYKHAISTITPERAIVIEPGGLKKEAQEEQK